MHTCHRALSCLSNIGGLIGSKFQLANTSIICSIMMTWSNGNIFCATGPFTREIHQSPVNSPHKEQWRGDLMFSLICASINDWVNNREAADLRRHRAHYDVIVMITEHCSLINATQFNLLKKKFKFWLILTGIPIYAPRNLGHNWFSYIFCWTSSDLLLIGHFVAYFSVT